MNGQIPHSREHGYVPGLPEYFTTDNYGRVAPPGWAFNAQGELVQLPYAPWSQGPQMGWEDPNNPDYLEYAQGRMSIETQPSADPRVALSRAGKTESVGHYAPVTHQDVALVPQRAYLDTQGDSVPQQDEGTGSAAIFDAPASIARTRYILSKDIMAYAEVEAPGPGSPLLVVPAGDAEGVGLAAPFGGAVALASFQFGHLGGQIANIIADVLPGTLVKVPTASSFMRVTGRMAPRYFASSDAGAAPNIVRTYLLFPGGPVLTNDSFSDLPPNIMELQGSGAGTIVAAGVQQNPINYLGWCARGYTSISSIDSLPQRIFRGSVPSAGPTPAAPFTNRARIPIPHGAQSVRMIGGFNNPADTPQAVAIQWTQNLDWTNAVTGPFQANTTQPIPIVQGATSIDVFAGNSAVANSIEVPFFAFFYLNI